MSRQSLPFSPAIIMAPPKNRETTMTWSMLALTNAPHMLLGKMSTSTDMKPLNALGSYSAAPSSAERSGNIPAPMKMLANTRPMTQAMAVVQRK